MLLLLRQPNRNSQPSVTFVLCVSSQAEVEEFNEESRERFDEQTGGQTSQVDISKTLTRGDGQRVTGDHNGSTAHTHSHTDDRKRQEAEQTFDLKLSKCCKIMNKVFSDKLKM